jgi:ferredoxin
MNTQIFYFTGTGNSLYISKKITSKLESVSLIPFVSLLQAKEPYRVDSQAVGFVFPVYFLQMPKIVKEALEKCKLMDDSYFFAAVTSGGDAGNTLFELDQLLKTQGGRLHYGIEIPLGDNSVVYNTSNFKFQQRLNLVDATLDRLAQAVKAKDVESENSAFKKSAATSAWGKIQYLAMIYYFQFKKHKVDLSRCTHCGLCQKVCPMNNISCKADQVSMGTQCKWCFACLNYCPNQAISFGRIHPSKAAQYHFPGINPTDISRQKSINIS